MRKKNIKEIILLSIIVSFFILSQNTAAQDKEPLVPPDLKTSEVFEAGFGEAIGKFQIVQGEVFVIHKHKNFKYLAHNNTPIFQYDTIIAQANSRARIILNDKSILVLSSLTKIEMTQLIYDQEKKFRSYFFEMVSGKARYLINKLLDLKSSRLKIKTQTAVIGVRASDFIVKATEKQTEITTLEKTVLEVLSLSALETKPTMLLEFERTIVSEGELPKEKEKISDEEVKNITKEFTYDIQQDTKDLSESKGIHSVDRSEKPAKEQTILIPEDKLVMPDEISKTVKPETEYLEKLNEITTEKEEKEKAQEQQEQSSEKKHEEIVNAEHEEPLPELPNKPQ
ncbi:MAG: FecR domain-containing protein [Desulfobacterales bacterium]|nr:FecR domain-containing protein [Desulfobacterales bacterium]